MIEQDPIRDEHAVRFPVIYSVPVCSDLRNAIRATGVKWTGFRLRWDGGSEHLTRSSIVDLYTSSDCLLKRTNRSEDIERTSSNDCVGVLRLIKGNSHVRLSREMVDLVRLNLGQQSE